ncbi:hypothetical protein [Natrialba taiwanensis]|uniref:Transcriptional regulator n=1 Tax=Natrialba taiwanensis DSM 12281 TaxID=1230458 RepID=M0A284_9EURY|nr:hypothetical protein [Natrialba taiwanensis]ELY91448.1 hypothetical protein C484_10486 [Natrialba taiwanensis DSM 12281]
MWIQHNRHDLEKLPEPGVEWSSNQIGMSKSNICKLRHEGLITLVERREYKSKANLYMTKPVVYQAVQAYLEMDDEDGFLPCGHDPFVNQGDVLECKICEKEHRKEAVQ